MGAGLERELFEELAQAFASTLECMAGERPTLSWDPLPSAPANADARWRQPMPPLPGAIWLLSTEQDSSKAGRLVLVAAGIEDTDAAEALATYQEIVGQTLGALAQVLTERLKQEVTPQEGKQASADPRPARWAEIHVKLGEHSFTVAAGIEDEFLVALAAPSMLAAAPPTVASQSAAATGGTRSSVSSGATSLGVTSGTTSASTGAAGNPGWAPGSRTFDLLLDVELPVSVSFGRAQVQLKDILKLTTGSIVELNRSVVDPVEIIVNNCVIARGEVVVVEGNFGVRIQEVISRQERLRTLQ